MPEQPGDGEPGEGGDRLSILHVDMDSFFVAVEVQADPALAGRPVIVGGAGARGVVASCSYEARCYGIHSAMPSARARRLCPRAVFLPGRYEAYAEVSRRFHDVLTSFTPAVEGIALDEAFLDVSGAHRLFGPAAAVARAVRSRVSSELDLDCSVGVARTKLLAKLASKAAKPRATRTAAGVRVEPGEGVVVVPAADELAFLHPLPVSALWGVGPATAAKLARLGVLRVGELAEVPRQSLVAAFGRAVGGQLHQLAMGRDSRPVEPDRETKSVGHEETYARDRTDRDFLAGQVVRMADAVAGRLRAAGKRGRTVTVKVRFGDFSTITRSRTEPIATAEGPAIARSAGSLLASVDVSPGVRLLGVSVSGLAGPSSWEGPVALPLGFGEASAGPDWGPATAAVDAVRARFGEGAVAPATLARGGRLDVKRVGDTQWGPSDPPPAKQ
ncbi:MAG: DNA polymerase IV [Acidimicrobiales bacterium]